MNKADLYDILSAEAIKILKLTNPCNIRQENGKWRCNYKLEWCCEGCKHLTPQGCSVDSLVCKLWLCQRAESHKTTVIALDSLKQRGRDAGLRVDSYRTTKEECIR